MVSDLQAYPEDLTIEAFAARIKRCSRCRSEEGTVLPIEDAGFRYEIDRKQFEADVASGRKKFTGDV